MGKWLQPRFEEGIHKSWLQRIQLLTITYNGGY